MLNSFRFISAIEGVSYLVLLFIAMPIKYILGNPYVVKVVGMTHGVLFIIFAIALFSVLKKLNWDKGFAFQLFVLSLIPFGAFLIEKRVKLVEKKVRK
ncbi:hypothetical protein CRU98_04125 [Arcobacter sp. CECT 8986]|uniref:DUF3817 domain-containing protein n=1 Tax=Arcobacter sp. CECT 8986 TaxID=2044507 RepID=UPI001009B5A7|nr:DUF3817 domain-containing protein [Arcobacter sp. CECT 8986]RXK00352.1 hypothetical protein CRU98_04125 [Arcobacter sp. CECT 8986]